MKNFSILLFNIILLNFSFCFENRDYLFIFSSPLKATILINDRTTDIVTPCVINDINKRKDKISKISIRKEGYKEYELSKQEIESKNVKVSLIPISFDIYFPEKITYKIGNSITSGPIYISKLKPGKYDLSIYNNILSISESNSFLPAEVGLGVAFGFSFASMITTIALSEISNYNANLAKKEGRINEYEYYKKLTGDIDIAKYISIGASGVFAISVIAVVSTDVGLRYYSQKKNIKISKKTPSNMDEMFYQTSLQFLSMGEIEKSTNILLSLISIYADSEYLPAAYYQLGQNYFITKDYSKAKECWNKFITEYPISEYYDYVLLNLGTIYYQEKDYEKSSYCFKRILYTGDKFSSELLNSSIANIYFNMAINSSNDEYFNLCEKYYQNLIEEYYSSENIDLYFHQLIKLYKSKKNDDKLSKLKEKLNKLSSINEDIKKIIFSYF